MSINLIATPSGWGQAGRRRRRPALLRHTQRWLRGLLLPVAGVIIWHILTLVQLFPAHLVPPPLLILTDILELAADGSLFTHIAVTGWRVVIGFALGAGCATLLAAIAGYYRHARDYLDPSLQALKAVPSLAWVPIFILWFGIFETSKVTLIAVGVFFPVYLNLLSGIDGTDRKLVEVGRINGLGRVNMVRRILLPATLPAYFTGLRAGLALGWMFVIAAELMGASEGLGFLMLDGQMTGRPSIIIAALVLFAIVGKLSDTAITAVSERLLHWRDDNFSLQEREHA